MLPHRARFCSFCCNAFLSPPFCFLHTCVDFPALHYLLFVYSESALRCSHYNLCFYAGTLDFGPTTTSALPQALPASSDGTVPYHIVLQMSFEHFIYGVKRNFLVPPPSLDCTLFCTFVLFPFLSSVLLVSFVVAGIRQVDETKIVQFVRANSTFFDGDVSSRIAAINQAHMLFGRPAANATRIPASRTPSQHLPLSPVEQGPASLAAGGDPPPPPDAEQLEGSVHSTTPPQTEKRKRFRFATVVHKLALVNAGT